MAEKVVGFLPDVEQSAEGVIGTISAAEQANQKFTINIFGGSSSVDPLMTLSTYGGWNIEGDFICVYSPGELKRAFRVPANARSITTTPYVDKPKKEEEKEVKESDVQDREDV